MDDWRSTLTETEQDQLVKAAMPNRVKPMLATLTDNHFSNANWVFERKLDGERCIAFNDGETVHLYTRNEKSLDATYPEICDALAAQEYSFAIDGEVVAFEGNLTSFSRLQERLQIKDEKEARASDIKVYYYIFDLLYLDGHDVSKLPLRQRKKLLHDTVKFDGPLRFTPHRDENGERFLEEACRKGWEGLIAKDANAAYKTGRSRKWLKFKCVNQQEMVIVGYTDPEGERAGFGALLLAFYESGKLRYAGRVGTGFDEKTLSSLRADLTKRETDSSPLADSEAADSKGVHWVKPELVGEIAFTEWTADNRLRHPSFLGLRQDKSPEDVIKEAPGARS